MLLSRRLQRRCSLPRLLLHSNWYGRASRKFIRKSLSHRSTCASALVRTEVLRRMTRKKTHKEKGSMPSVAKKLVVVHNNEPAAKAVTPEPTTRPEELRLLEALLFA